MKILYLGYPDSNIVKYLKNLNYHIFQTQEKIDYDFVQRNQFDYLISYGYRFLISEEVINYFGDKAINLHISYLPWNRGADPNLWSHIDNTPKGVTIHQLDKGLDTGDIIVQQKVRFSTDDTLASSYEKLHEDIQNLFINNWHMIEKKKIEPQKQDLIKGSLHKQNEKNIIMDKLPLKWQTPLKDLAKI